MGFSLVDENNTIVPVASLLTVMMMRPEVCDIAVRTNPARFYSILPSGLFLPFLASATPI